MTEDDRLRALEARVARIESYLSAEDGFDAAEQPAQTVEVPPSASGKWLIETRIVLIGGMSQWEPFAEVDSAEAVVALLEADVERRAVAVPVGASN